MERKKYRGSEKKENSTKKLHERERQQKNERENDYKDRKRVEKVQELSERCAVTE